MREIPAEIICPIISANIAMFITGHARIIYASCGYTPNLRGCGQAGVRVCLTPSSGGSWSIRQHGLEACPYPGERLPTMFLDKIVVATTACCRRHTVCCHCQPCVRVGFSVCCKIFVCWH